MKHNENLYVLIYKDNFIFDFKKVNVKLGKNMWKNKTL